jgi:N-acetylmuramoyl-L-alanine amidase
MSFKLALSAGHGLYTAGKRCLKSIDKNETREWWLNDRICDRIEVLLAAYEGIEVLRVDDTTGKTDVALAIRSNAANKWKADFYLAVHANAGINGGSGGGIQAYAYNGSVPQETLNWQKALYNELIKLTGLKGNRSNGCPRANFHECREPYMHAVLLELGFMDSTTDVPIILSQDFAYKCAQACVNVIVAKAGLKKKVTAPTVGATYKVITTINRYASAADAAAKANSKGTYEAGTYYIFSKYPNGLNGMYNISTDKTGASAGSWINPSENKVVEVKNDVQKLYRVRKSKDDAKTQKGAYSNLDNAKAACQEAGTGYHVFDWDYKIVYSYTAPVQPEKPKEEPKVEPTPTPTPSVTNVYDLNFPIKTKIVDPDVVQTEGINEEDCTQAIVAIVKNNPNFNIEIA